MNTIWQWYLLVLDCFGIKFIYTNPFLLIMKVGKHFEFEASHILPNHPGKCSMMHGHSYKLIVAVDGIVEKDSGMVVDFSVISDIVKKEIIDKYDHRHLNDYFDNPTAENIVKEFYNLINKNLKNKTNGKVKLSTLKLYETSNSFVEIDKENV